MSSIHTNYHFDYLIRAAHLNCAIREIELMKRPTDEIEVLIRENVIKLLTDRKAQLFRLGMNTLNENGESLDAKETGE